MQAITQKLLILKDVVAVSRGVKGRGPCCHQGVNAAMAGRLRYWRVRRLRIDYKEFFTA
jgi:hypothetical protein